MHLIQRCKVLWPEGQGVSTCRNQAYQCLALFSRPSTQVCDISTLPLPLPRDFRVRPHRSPATRPPFGLAFQTYQRARLQGSAWQSLWNRMAPRWAEETRKNYLKWRVSSLEQQQQNHWYNTCKYSCEASQSNIYIYIDLWQIVAYLAQ